MESAKVLKEFKEEKNVRFSIARLITFRRN